MTVTDRVGSLARRPAVAALLLLAVYLGLSLVNDTGGYLGTDTGAKAATLEHMVEADTNRPTVGYWAQDVDPDGDYHPLFDSRRNDRGEWVNVTTLPMLLTARPLYELGGYRMALLLPMLGSVGAALAARSIARRLADDAAGTWAFWVVGLASPAAVYALDLWEHAIGAALMLWAAALLLRTVEEEGRAWMPLLAGGLLAASATMRAEALPFTLVLVGTTCVLLLSRRDVVRSVATGALAVVGFVGPWLANVALESDLGGNSRTARVSEEASREVWTEVGDRIGEAFVTWFGLPGFSSGMGVVLGVVVVASILGARALHRRGEHRPAAYALVAAVLVYVVMAASGFGFVSGALVASPVAVAAAWAPRRGPVGRFLLPVALLSTVLIWTYQILGGADPQWGGRYLLAPTLLLTTIGVIALRDAPEPIRRTVLGLAIGVTVFGVAWLGSRSHQVDEFFDDLARQPEDVVISTNGFLVREGGPAYEDRRYLSLGRGAGLQGAVDVVEKADLDTFAVLSTQRELPEIEATPLGVDEKEFLGTTFWYHRYELP